MSTDKKVWGKGSVRWRPSVPARLCCAFSGKQWLTAKEFTESVTQVSNYHDVDFQCGAFSVFLYLFGLKQLGEKFRNK